MVVDVINVTCAKQVSTDVGYIAIMGVGGVGLSHWMGRWEVDED